MFTEIADKAHIVKGFTPFPRACERSFYDELPEAVKARTLKKGEKNLDFEFKALPITAFMDFYRNGNRSRFESLYFSKRHALNALVMAECVEHKGRFMDAIVSGIYSICEESAWQLPAHNSYERGGPNFPLPDVTDPVIDLFAAETGATLSLISYLLFDELEAVSPFINKMIRHNLKRRIYEPYMNRHFWWMGNGDEPMCNWTVWCVQNVLIAVFLGSESSEGFKDTVIKKAAYSIDCFLKDYGEDGCCDEGAHYYRRSALCMFDAAKILDAVTDGAFKEVFKQDKIKNLATYIFNVHVKDRYYFNFADCPATLDRAGALEFLFAKEAGNEEMMRYAALDYKIDLKEQPARNEEEVSLYVLMQGLFTAKEMLSFDTEAPVVHRDCVYESVGLYIARDAEFSLAVKGGDNDDSHNHNDTGSITLYKDGKPILIDAGVETYTAKTFSSRRYEIWTMQSAYHNLPTINGVMQEAGAKFHASRPEYSFTEKEAVVSLDIAGAYPESAGISSYVRTVRLEREKRVTVSDMAEFKDTGRDNSFFLSLMLCEKPKIDGNRIILPSAAIEFESDADLSFETIEIIDDRLKWTWKGDLYRVIAKPKGNCAKFTII